MTKGPKLPSFRTEFNSEKYKSDLRINYTDKLVSLGSCFAQNIGQRLTHFKYKISNNPFGIIYNPISIANALTYLLNDYEFVNEDLFQHQNQWHSFHHHGDFSDTKWMNSLNAINESLNAGRKALAEADYLLITLGTARVYKFVETGQVVANCHKVPSSHFSRSLLKIEEIFSTLNERLIKLTDFNPKLKVIFTISPIRHLKDGFHANQISKATLLMAVEKLVEEHSNAFYFPAYEIMLDDLRDYRFYANDLNHPSDLAIAYIWDNFDYCYLNQEESTIRKRIDKLQKAVQHRPLKPNSAGHRMFVEKQLYLIKLLEDEYGFLDLSREKTILERAIPDS